MNNFTRAYPFLFRPLATTLAAASLLGIIGCGDDSGLGKRYKVSGTVTYKGAPVEKAVINFVTADPQGRGATGQVETGMFSLTTLTPNDGALPGKYKVTVDSRQIDQSALEAKSSEDFAKKGVKKLSMVPQEYQAKALASAKSQLPGKYQIAETTDIELEVKPESNNFTIELKD